MPVSGIDHAAVPAGNPAELLAFYNALGFATPTLEELKASALPVFSVACGAQKINFHLPELWQSERFDLRGPTATPGCGDFCFVWEGSEDELRRALDSVDSAPILGPVRMLGGQGRGASIYTRDPDENLVEFIFYDPAQVSSDIQERLKI